MLNTRRAGFVGIFPGMRPLLVIALLAPALARAEPAMIVRCSSGKTGTVALFVERDGSTWTLSSRDEAAGEAARVFHGQVVRATRRTSRAGPRGPSVTYVFELADGTLEQPSGLDDIHCVARGPRATCDIDRIEVTLRKRRPAEPGDAAMGVSTHGQPITLDNGGPQACSVPRSKTLDALLGR